MWHIAYSQSGTDVQVNHHPSLPIQPRASHIPHTTACLPRPHHLRIGMSCLTTSPMVLHRQRRCTTSMMSRQHVREAHRAYHPILPPMGVLARPAIAAIRGMMESDDTRKGWVKVRDMAQREHHHRAHCPCCLLSTHTPPVGLGVRVPAALHTPHRMRQADPWRSVYPVGYPPAPNERARSHRPYPPGPLR